MEISAVKVRNSYQIYFVDSNNLFARQNSQFIVETEHGIDIGNIIKSPSFQKNTEIEVNGKLIRKANNDDLKNIPSIESIEKKAFKECREKVKNKKLDMKLISVKCLFDKTKIIFYFIAENRIDFRELVRELASVFRTRIEMRQIGVRDEARLVGGYGPCGKQLCCVHQREEFEPVSIKMAKEQNLNLNSLKISGMCGRLLCCLGYEYSTYKELNKQLPYPGTEIIGDETTYIVRGIDTLKESLNIKDGDRFIKISKYDLEFRNKKYYIKKEAIEKIKHPEEEEENNEDDIYKI